MNEKSFCKIVESYRHHHLLGIISVSCVIELLQCSHTQRYLQSLHLLLPFVKWNSGPRRIRGFFNWFFSSHTTLPAPVTSHSFVVWQRESCSLLSQSIQKEFTVPLKYGQPASQLWGQKQLLISTSFLLTWDTRSNTLGHIHTLSKPE